MCRNGTRDCPGTTFYNKGLFDCSHIGCECECVCFLHAFGFEVKLETCVK